MNKISNYIRHVKLIDGTKVLVRQICPGDDNNVFEFLNSCSLQTKYMRFFCGKSTITPEEVKFFTDVDFNLHYAIVGEIETTEDNIKVEKRELIAMARYIRLSEDNQSCEMAIIVMDKWQNKHLGRNLLLSLIDIAKVNGIKWIIGYVLLSNNIIIHLFRKAKFYTILKNEYGSLKYKIRI